MMPVLFHGLESLLHYAVVCPIFLLLEWLLCRLYRRQGIAYGKGFVIGWQMLMVLLTAMFCFTGTAGVEDVLRFGTSLLAEDGICATVADHLTAEMLLNVLLFVPLGILLPLLWNNHGLLQNIISGFLLSMLIECSQLFNYRSSDINDLLMNTLGMCLGYGIFLLFFHRTEVCQAQTADKLTLAAMGSIGLAFVCYVLLASPLWTWVVMRLY